MQGLVGHEQKELLNTFFLSRRVIQFNLYFRKINVGKARWEITAVWGEKAVIYNYL